MRQVLYLSLIMLSAAFTQCGSEAPKSPKVTAEGKNVRVVYGQPSKRDRVIFGELEPYGKVWRAGANEATEITFRKNAQFAGKPVKAGTYTFFIIPSQTEWTVILNSELKQWGAYGYEKIKDKNVLEATVPVRATEGVVEKLTYRFTDADNLIVEWDQTRVEIPISTD